MRRPQVLVPNELVYEMKPGSVLVDVSIDQGGCFADSRPTHDQPTYRVHESVFYCVANMPGVVPRTYVMAIAAKGWRRAWRDDPALAHGINIHDGHVVNALVAKAHGFEVLSLSEVVA